MEIINARGGLERFQEAVKGEGATLGFIGGSITEAANEGNWPEFIRGWFVRRFPGKKLFVENAAIGGTSSLCGLMRADKELIGTGCDLVFVEYAVNDPMFEREFYMRTREGLVRRLLRSNIDVVIVYTFCQNMYEELASGKVPLSIAEFEKLAERYNVPSVWMSKNAYDSVRSGRVSWEAWLPISGGSLHPDYLGSSLYAEPVVEFLERELSVCNPARMTRGDSLAPALDPEHYENVREIPIESVETLGPWVYLREVFSPWFRRNLYTSADGASLSFRFSGRAVGAMLNFGKRTAVFDVRVDGGEWTEYLGERSDWVPDKNFTGPAMFFRELAPGEHLFELRIKHGNRPECKGCECKIFSFYSFG